MIAYIYKITNTLNGKIYVGYTTRPEKRWYEHQRDSINPKRGFVLHLAMRKYGVENFTFDIIYCSKDVVHALTEMEPYFIRNLNSISLGYNLSDGGVEPILCEAARKRMSESKMGDKNTFFGKSHSQDTKKAISDCARKRIGEKNPFFGKTHSQESKEKMKISRQHIQKRGEHPLAKKVVVNGIVFNCMKDVSESFGIKYKQVVKILSGKVSKTTAEKYGIFEFRFI